MVDRRGSENGQDFRELVPGHPGELVVGCWRQGNLMVLHRDAPLPGICLVTAAPTSLRTRRIFSFVPGMVWLTILLSPFVWLLVRWLVCSKIVLHLPLAEAYVARERRLRKVRAVFAGIGLLMLTTGIWQLIDTRLPTGGWEMIVGGLLIASGVFFWSLLASTRLRVVRYEEPYSWLLGVHPQVVEQLAQWPYE